MGWPACQKKLFLPAAKNCFCHAKNKFVFASWQKTLCIYFVFQGKSLATQRLYAISLGTVK
jgi:hypothetical protein